MLSTLVFTSERKVILVRSPNGSLREDHITSRTLNTEPLCVTPLLQHGSLRSQSYLRQVAQPKLRRILLVLPALSGLWIGPSKATVHEVVLELSKKNNQIYFFFKLTRIAFRKIFIDFMESCSKTPCFFASDADSSKESMLGH